MARTKLIAKYSALNTEDLPQRIYNKVKTFIDTEGIEHLPELELSGRWTGKLDISTGGWRNDYDLVLPLLEICLVDRHGEVLADMNKIIKHVDSWKKWLETPDEYDDDMCVSDEYFDDAEFDSDELNQFQSDSYNDEFQRLVNNEHPDFASYDNALSVIDFLCGKDGGDSECVQTEEGPLFEEGYNVKKITSADDFRSIMKAMDLEAAEGGGISWTSPDIDKIMEEFESGPSWMEFIDDLRNGRYGDLPEDYDGLSDPDPEIEQ